MTEQNVIAATLNAENAIARVLASPASSDWLKAALRTALERDAVNAAHDADTLARLLRDRLAGLMNGWTPI